MSKKLLVTDTKGERELLLAGTMTVGRDTSCDISYNDPLLSRRHAEFVLSNDAVIVRDLASSNGILVNGVKVGEASLRASDLVQIANLRFRCVEDNAPTAVAPEADGGDDSTRMTPSPVFTPASKAAPPPKMTAATPASPAGPAGEGQIHPAPAPSPAMPDPRPEPPWLGYGAPGRSPTGEVRPVAVPPLVKAERKARTARTSWAGTVLIQIMGLVAVVFAITAVSMSVFQSGLLDATDAGGRMILLGAALYFSLLAGLVVAMALRRMTLKALTVLNEDIKLAVAGQLQEVGDPLGAKPVKELADSVNDLVARLKACGGDPAGAGSPFRAAAPAAAAAPRPGGVRPVAHEE